MILGKNVNIKIRDDGIGMTKEHRGNLFAYKFTTKKDGTGIGLHLSQKMIKILGGDIAVSTEKDIGSEFVVCLPLTRTLD
jgi:signal transduction histidine kinase